MFCSVCTVHAHIAGQIAPRVLFEKQTCRDCKAREDDHDPSPQKQVAEYLYRILHGTCWKGIHPSAKSLLIHLIPNKFE